MTKSKSFCKLLGIGLGLIGVIAPMSIILTSCFNPDLNNFYEINFNKDIPTSLKQMKKSTASLEKLISGTKSYHNGNYVIILASNVSKESNTWFTKNALTVQNYNEDNVFAGAYISAMQAAQSNFKQGQNFGVYLYFDNETQNDANKNPMGNEEFKAYNYKWTDSDVSAYKAQPGHEDDNKTIVKDKYARNDASAKGMRSLTDNLTTLFGKNFSYSSPSSLPYLMAWKDGIPQTKDDKDKSLEACWKTLKTDSDFINIINYLNQSNPKK